MSMSEQDKQRAKDKIRKLLAMGLDGRGNEYEAERAMVQAEALMRKYGIDQAELEEQTITYDWDSVSVAYNRTDPNWRVTRLPMWWQWLCTGVGKYTDTLVNTCHVSGQLGIMFKGDAQDLTVAEWMIVYLQEQVDKRTEAQVDLDRAGKSDFRKAMGMRLHTRLVQLRKERDKEYAEHVDSKGRTGNALIIVNNKLKLRDERFGEQKYGKASVTMRDGSASARGRSAGDSVNINRTIKSSAPSHKMLTM